MTDFPIVEYLRENSDAGFEYVELGGTRRAGDPPRYFLADYRDGSGYPDPWVCIHQWTASPVSLLRNIAWQTNKLWVFEARNKGQVAVWLEQYGYRTQHMGQRPPLTYPHRRIIVNNRDRSIAAAQQRIAAEQARIDRLMSLPAEPTTEDPDNALVVWFQHRFNIGGQIYTYAAVKAGDDKWYTTGPASPKGYTWDQLVEWHFTAVNDDNPMYTNTEWEALA